MDNYESPNNESTVKQKKTAWLYDLYETVIVSFIIVFAMFILVMRTAVVNGKSMTDTLQHGDKLIVWELFYTPKQGDIVVCQSEYQEREALVKRVIATEGQTVRIDSNNWKVYVDGKELKDDNVRYVAGKAMGGLVYGDECVVPEGKIFVMGDNRSASLDSRSSAVGFIDEDWVMGKVVMRIFPFSSFRFM